MWQVDMVQDSHLETLIHTYVIYGICIYYILWTCDKEALAPQMDVCVFVCVCESVICIYAKRSRVLVFILHMFFFVDVIRILVALIYVASASFFSEKSGKFPPLLWQRRAPKRQVPLPWDFACVGSSGGLNGANWPTLRTLLINIWLYKRKNGIIHNTYNSITSKLQ